MWRDSINIEQGAITGKVVKEKQRWIVGCDLKFVTLWEFLCEWLLFEKVFIISNETLPTWQIEKEFI